MMGLVVATVCTCTVARCDMVKGQGGYCEIKMLNTGMVNRSRILIELSVVLIQIKRQENMGRWTYGM